MNAPRTREQNWMRLTTDRRLARSFRIFHNKGHSTASSSTACLHLHKQNNRLGVHNECRSLLVLLAVCSSRGGRVESSESAEPLCDAMMTLTTRNSHPTSVCATCASVEDLRSFQAEHQSKIHPSVVLFLFRVWVHHIIDHLHNNDVNQSISHSSVAAVV